MRWLIASLLSRPRTAVKKRAPHRITLRLDALEDRLTPAGFFLTGVGGFTNPAEPNVRIYDSSSVAGGTSTFLNPPGDIAAFNPDLMLPGRGPTPFIGSVRVASGDVNGDGIDDIITAQGPGGTSASQVKIFDGNSAIFLGTRVEIASFFAYSDSAGASQNPGFGGGVFVASADFNNDGFDELVVSAGAGARGHIKVFNFNVGGVFQGSTPELRASFFAYTDFAGEIRVTTGFYGGNAFLITGSGAGTTQSDVRVYQNAFNIGEIPDLTFVAPIAQLFPFTGYTGGVSVAAGDTDGDGIDELFVSKNSGESTVLVIDAGTLATRATFTAFGGFNGEVRLGAADVDGDGRVEVLTSTGTSPGAGGAHVKAWSITGATADTIRSFFAYEGYINGVFLSTNDFNWTQTFTNTTPIVLTDGTATFTASNIVVDPRTFVDSARPTSIRVSLNTTTFFNADTDAFLQSPTGVQFELTTDNGGGGDGMQVIFSDTAATNITAAPVANPLTGTFRPEGAGSFLLTYGAAGVAGTWTLLIRDDFGGFPTTLTSWAIGFTF